MRLAPALIALTALCARPAAANAEVRWQLDCKPGTISTITLKGAEGAGTYAYMTFTVSNATGREVPLSLGVWADTDVAKRSYRGTIDPIVQAELERRTGKKFMTLTQAREKPLADGASAELLVSFGKIDPNVDLLDIKIVGLADRVYRDQGKTWVEDKALRLQASRDGDEFARQNDLLRLTSTKWIVLAPAVELKRA